MGPHTLPGSPPFPWYFVSVDVFHYGFRTFSYLLSWDINHFSFYTTTTITRWNLPKLIFLIRISLPFWMKIEIPYLQVPGEYLHLDTVYLKLNTLPKTPRMESFPAYPVRTVGEDLPAHHTDSFWNCPWVFYSHKRVVNRPFHMWSLFISIVTVQIQAHMTSIRTLPVLVSPYSSLL